LGRLPVPIVVLVERRPWADVHAFEYCAPPFTTGHQRSWPARTGGPRPPV